MIEVMIQAEAGSSEKIRFDERTLEPIAAGRVSRPYPHPYGFVLETTAADGDNADCYVFGGAKLQAGSIVECDVVGLLEQIESDEPDHKVLAFVAGQEPVLPDHALQVQQDFIYGIFSDYANTTVNVAPCYLDWTGVRPGLGVSIWNSPSGYVPGTWKATGKRVFQVDCDPWEFGGGVRSAASKVRDLHGVE
jgi:hypothetical protein